jgi:flagellar motor switch protein FliN
MDNGKLISKLESVDNGLLNQVQKIASDVLGTPIKINYKSTQETSSKDIDPLKNQKLLRIDIPIKNGSTGISFVVQTGLDDSLVQYLDGTGDEKKNLPDSMQHLLDIAEGYIGLLNKHIGTLPDKKLEFENPSLTTWQIKEDFSYDATLLSRFAVNVNTNTTLEIIRLFPTSLLKELIEETNSSLGRENSDAYLESFENEKPKGGNVLPLEDLYDLQLEVSAELGRTNMTLQKVLDMGKGGIIELNKFAGDPVELFINSKKFAEGEVVVVDQNFAVRITRLLTDKERLKSISAR